MLQPKKKAVIPVPKTKSSEVKEHNSREDYTLPYSMRQRKDTPEEIAAAREQRILASQQARTVPWTKSNWRDKLAMETSATGDKLRFSSKPNFFDDNLNLVSGIGHLASGLGAAPLKAEEQKSIKPYFKAVAAPLVAGVLGGIGTKSTAGFVNNMVNPLAGSGTSLIRAKDAVKRGFKGRLTKVSAVFEAKRLKEAAAKGIAKDKVKEGVANELDGKSSGYAKQSDFPFSNLSNEDASAFKRTGTSGEINKAISESLKEKNARLYSGGTGHTGDGQIKYDNLERKGLVEKIAESNGNIYMYKKYGGKLNNRKQ